MAARKIVSQTQDATVSFKLLGLDIAPVLTESKTYTDKDGIEREAKTGQVDPTFVPEIDVIELCVIGDRVYHSVHGNYTTAMLKPTEENDYVIEKNLDGNFTFTVLDNNGSIKAKYEADPTYLDFLGLPAYNPEVDKTNLKHVGVGDPEEVDGDIAEQAAAFDQKVIDSDNAVQAALEASRKAEEDRVAADQKIIAAQEAAKAAEHKTETEGE